MSNSSLDSWIGRATVGSDASDDAFPNQSSSLIVTYVMYNTGIMSCPKYKYSTNVLYSTYNDTGDSLN